MSGETKKPEQTTETDRSADKIQDLPNKTIREEDAQAVKGGSAYLKSK
jgi:hypothetical protein